MRWFWGVLAVGIVLSACSSGGGNASGCPSSPPTGQRCSVAEDVVCNYPGEACGAGYSCRGGYWGQSLPSSVSLAIASCPADPPKNGDPCTNPSFGPCSGAQPAPLECSYGCRRFTCNGSAFAEIATCDAGADADPDASDASTD